MVVIAFLSFLAGMLSALAPCVLPFLPVIVGGSLDSRGGWVRPLVVSGSLVVSLLVFTLLLKVSTWLIGIDPGVWSIISGVLVIFLGLVMLFPGIWAKFMIFTNFSGKSHEVLDSAQSRGNGIWSAVLTGAALGPVFSSCNPTYVWVIATVLPASPAKAVFYLAVYCLGLALVLLAIAVLGRLLVERLGWLVNPYGWFQRVLAIIFILVGVLVLTGFDKKIQSWASDWVPSFTQVEQMLVPESNVNSGGSGSVQRDLIPPGRAAPELEGMGEWINSDPTSLRELRGKVVLVDFWTYSCINCQRTQPYLNAWYENYHDKGFEIIGVHAPEFSFEKVVSNVRAAVQDANIKYRVALDNDFSTWRAYNNQFWPAKYLIDKNGDLRYTHFGEGKYEETERAIQSLLGVKSSVSAPSQVETGSFGQSPETYLGVNRASGFVGTPVLQVGERFYQRGKKLKVNEWTLSGKWEVNGEGITAVADDSVLRYRFAGKKMFLVMGASEPSAVKVSVEGGVSPGGKDVLDGEVKIGGSRLYRLVELPDVTGSTLVTITFSKGVSANAFTFG